MYRWMRKLKRKVMAMMEAPFDSIDATEAAEYLRTHPEAVILDVRTDEEWSEGHIHGALHIDVRDLPQRIHDLPQDRTTLIVCICAVGGRSAAACDYLAQNGYTRLVNVDGGMTFYTGEVVTGV